MISINRGEITISSPTKDKTGFENYFKTVNYLVWDDLREPIIRFSDDGSMAYIIVEKDVVVKIVELNPETGITKQQVKFGAPINSKD